MGGIGKTQLAVEFAYRYGRFFHGVHWLHCDRHLAIGTEIARAGEEMNLSPWPLNQPEQADRTLQAWGQDGHRHLVILDNLEDVEAARDWLLPLRRAGAALLLTARRSDWPEDLGLSPLPIRLFTKTESRQFLRKYLPAKRAKPAGLDRLAERLGYLPLALELAGRYLKRLATLSLDTYLAKLDDVLSHRSMQGWEVKLGNPTDHDLRLLETFALSWEELEGETQAQRVFALAGHCAPYHPIPCKLLSEATGLEEEACAEALARLTALSLLEMDDPASGPTVHPLLAEYARTLLTGQEEGAFAPLPALTEALVPLAVEANVTGLPTRFAPFRPHVESVASADEAAQLEGAATLWNEAGYHLKMVADYEGARAAYKRALAIDEATFGPNHPNVATVMSNLGSVLHALGDNEEAQESLQRALAIFEHHHGLDHPNVATLVNNQGVVLQDLGDFEGARAAFERALAIGEAVYGPEHAKVAIRLDNLAGVLYALGDYARAREACERALTIGEAVFGPDHPAVTRVVNNLGNVLRALGDYTGARAAYERALAIDETIFGPSHPAVATGVNNLGVLLLDLGDYEGARTAYERALAIRERTLGRQHPDTAATLWWLGTVESEVGDFIMALGYLEEALEILEAFLPMEHPNLKIVREHLAAVQSATNQRR
jgi:tetratricopeptide (TPR) repeat protein